MADHGVLLLLPGACFHERYRVVRRIKAGGMGAVYEVVDDRTDSPRALKVMLPSLLADAEMRARFALEAKVTGNIASDHLVRVSDAGIDEPTGTPFLVMELLQGEELAALIEKRGPLPPAEVVLYLHQTALALDKTHAAGIVHRDLKPENLFVTHRDDGSPCVKILDFGIAKVVAQGTAQTTRAVGTPIYMAPEQIRGQATIGPRADLSALGHIAYALLAGEAYWQEELKGASSVFPLLTQIVEGIPEAPALRARRRRGVELPPGFDAWMKKAVATRPDDRFERAVEQIAALAEVLDAPVPRATLLSMAPSGSPPSSRAEGGAPARGLSGSLAAASSTPGGPASTKPRTKLVAAVGFGAGTLLAVGAFVMTRHGETPPPAPAAAASTIVEGPSAPAPPVSSPSVAPPATVAPTTPTTSTATTSARQPAAKAPAAAAVPRPSAAPRAALPPAAPAPAARNCNPPFSVDADGIKHAKPECL
jgi:serine/threonine protein kinase